MNEDKKWWVGGQMHREAVLIDSKLAADNFLLQNMRVPENVPERLRTARDYYRTVFAAAYREYWKDLGYLVLDGVGTHEHGPIHEITEEEHAEAVRSAWLGAGLDPVRFTGFARAMTFAAVMEGSAVIEGEEAPGTTNTTEVV